MYRYNHIYQVAQISDELGHQLSIVSHLENSCSAKQHREPSSSEQVTSETSTGTCH